VKEFFVGGDGDLVVAVEVAQWLIQPLVCSTAQRRGWTVNPWSGFGLKTSSTLTPDLAAASATVWPV
jgi:hypothetical protein